MDDRKVLGVSDELVKHFVSNPYLARRPEMTLKPVKKDATEEAFLALKTLQDEPARYLHGYPRQKSDHQLRVEEFMEKAGQEIPDKPTIPSEEVRLLRAKLILEEALETIDALGFTLFPDNRIKQGCSICSGSLEYEPHNDGCNLRELVDGCCDIAVVTTGTLSAFGISDVGPQRAVDESNLKKFEIPKCPTCGAMCEVVDSDGGYKCESYLNGHCAHRILHKGPYRRNDGKWVKPTDWQPPDWEKILAEQGYMEDEPNLAIGHVPKVPKVTDEEVPVGPGDGLRKRAKEDKEYHYTAYQGHLCPRCRTGLNDEAVKQMCLTGNAFRCPECLVHLTVMTEYFDFRPKVLALNSHS